MNELAALTGFAPKGYEWLAFSVFLGCIALVFYVATKNRR